MPLPWLEIRCDGPVHRRAVGAGRKRLLPEDQAQILSAHQDWRRALDLYGAAGKAAPATGMGVCARSIRANLHLEALAGMQLATGDGGWDRFKPRLIPASGQSQFGSAVQGGK